MSVLDRPFPLRTGEASRGLRRALSLTMTLALIVLAILLPVVQSSDEAAQGYRIRALQQESVDLEAQIYASQSEIAQLGSLARVDREARTRLGMVPATREVAVSVDVPPPAVHALPNRYLVTSAVPAPPASTSRWQKLLHLFPLP